MGLSFKIYKDGALVGTEVFDRDIIKIGRLSSAHLRLEDEKVSRIHAVIEVAANKEIHIIDMGSAEGTFVNGVKVNKSGIKHGDEIRLGDTRLVFQAEGQGEVVGEPAQEAAPVVLAAPAEPVITTPPAAPERPASILAPPREPERVEAPAAPVAAPVQQAAPLPPKAPRIQPAPAPVAAAAALETEPRPLTTHRVALPPPRKAGDFEDDANVTPQNWALEVRKLWGQRVLDVKYFPSTAKQVLVGDGKEVSFFAPTDYLPTDRFPIARIIGHEVMLSFGAKASGELQKPDGSVTPLSEVVKGSKVGRDPQFSDCLTLSLQEGAVATLMFGRVGFRFRYTNKPAGFMSTVSDRIDYTFLNTLLLVLFIYAAMVATFHLRPKAVETSEEELYKVPDRYVQFILTRPKPEKKDLQFLDKLKSDIDANKSSSAERYKGQEGKMGLKGRPDTGKRSAVRAIKPDDKELVGNKGLMQVLGAGGPQGLSTVMGGTGLGGELEGAIGNMFGQQIGDSGGFGGLGLRGTGSGGGGMGNTIGVGRLGTRGRGGGSFGYGAGVARIRQRGEADVNISIGKPIIMGSLSMEIIRRVIQSHRDQIKYCYSKELTRSPNLKGKVSIKFTISPKGYVTQSTVSQTTMNNATVESCICQKIRTWKFPEPQGGGIVIVNYPFIFTAGGG